MTRKPDAEVVRYVNTALLCERFNTLPHEGGLYDQPFKLVLGMQFVMEAIQEKQELDKPKSKGKGRR